MRAEDARNELNARLGSIAERRERLSREVDQEALRLGAVARLLKEHYGQAQSASAATAGVSAAYLGELISKAQAAEVEADDPIGSVVRVAGHQAAAYVRERNASVDRIIASFADFDTLFMSGVHPRALARDDFLNPPHMMWHLDPDDEWIAIDKVQVGYGGTGPGWAQRALRDLGLSDDLITEIAGARVSDVDTRTGQAEHSDHWPKFNVPSLRLAPGGWVYSPLDGEVGSRGSRLFQRMYRSDDDTLGGFYPNLPDTSPLQRWLDLLDGPDCPAWATGSRTARVYLDESLAPRLDSPFRGYRPPYTVIIEQGDLQLWMQAFAPQDQTQWLSEEVYEVLGAAGVYPGDVAEKDARSLFWRWVNTHIANRPRPPLIDIGGALRHDPNESRG